MRRFSLLRVVVVLVAVLLLTAVFTGRKAVLHAQSGCDATTLNASYASSLTGSLYDNQYNVYLLASAGRLAFDGAGNITGADTFNFDGTSSKRTITGTYTMNADCTGSLAFQGSDKSSLHADFVTADNAKEIHLVETDAGVILSGNLKKQNP